MVPVDVVEGSVVGLTEADGLGLIVAHELGVAVELNKGV